MNAARPFRPDDLEILEDRALLSGAGVVAGLTPVVDTYPYVVVRLQENLQAARQGGANVVFLGDSLTDFWRTIGASVWAQRVAPLGAVDMGIAGVRTANVLSEVEAGELSGRPKAVVLMIGTNDVVAGETAGQVASGVAAVVTAVRQASPGSAVVLMSLPPLIGGADDPANREVLDIDAALAGLADGANVHYVDFTSSFFNPDGSRVDADYHDVVHLSAEGYEAWADALTGPLDAALDVAAPAAVSTPAPGLASTPAPTAPVLIAPPPGTDGWPSPFLTPSAKDHKGAPAWSAS